MPPSYISDMPRFIEKPNLPQRRAEALIIGARYHLKLEKSLAVLGILPIWMPDNTAIDLRIASHADMSAVYLGNGRLIVAASLLNEHDFVNKLTKYDVKIIPAESSQSRKYPYDAPLNACLVGGTLVHNLKIIDSAVIREFSGQSQIEVNQGYSRCALCIVNENAFITSDAGIARSLESCGAEVLVISSEGVVLDGFDKGFIGGASFNISHDTIAFTGSLRNHTSRDAILRFIREHGKKAAFLTDEEIFDIGSAVLLTERP